MGIIVDLCIIAILVLCVFIGYKRGLAGSIFKIISFFLAIVITFVIYKPVTKIVVEKTKINETLKNSIVSKFQNEEIKEDENQKDEGMLRVIREKIKNTSEESKSKVIEDTATDVSDKIITIGVTIILFLVVRLLLLIVAFILNLITEIPVIKQFDQIGGIIYGFLQGAIIVFLIMAVISFFDALGSLKDINNAVSSSYLGSEIREVIKYKLF